MLDRNKSRPRRVTAQDVADLAGVSRFAVSRAFTPGGYVDAEKRLKIQHAAEQLGYRPNALAAGLQGGRSDLVAIFVGEMPNEYDKEVTSQLVVGLNTAGKWPIVIGGSGQAARDAISNVLRYPLEAMILRSGSMDVDIVDACEKLGIPVISSGRPTEREGVDSICVRNAEGMRKATKLLIDRGRRRFAYIGGPETFWSSIDRRSGMLAQLHQADLTLVGEATGDFTVSGGHQAAFDVLKAKPDAIICANDATAIGAMSALNERGLQVSKDVSVVGFDDIAMAAWPNISLTTVHNPINALVAHIVELLSQRNEDPNRDAISIEISADLVLRTSH